MPASIETPRPDRPGLVEPPATPVAPPDDRPTTHRSRRRNPRPARNEPRLEPTATLEPTPSAGADGLDGADGRDGAGGQRLEPTAVRRSAEHDRVEPTVSPEPTSLDRADRVGPSPPRASSRRPRPQRLEPTSTPLASIEPSPTATAARGDHQQRRPRRRERGVLPRRLDVRVLGPAGRRFARPGHLPLARRRPDGACRSPRDHALDLLGLGRRSMILGSRARHRGRRRNRRPLRPRRRPTPPTVRAAEPPRRPIRRRPEPRRAANDQSTSAPAIGAGWAEAIVARSAATARPRPARCGPSSRPLVPHRPTPRTGTVRFRGAVGRRRVGPHRGVGSARRAARRRAPSSPSPAVATEAPAVLPEAAVPVSFLIDPATGTESPLVGDAGLAARRSIRAAGSSCSGRARSASTLGAAAGCPPRASCSSPRGPPSRARTPSRSPPCRCSQAMPTARRPATGRPAGTPTGTTSRSGSPTAADPSLGRLNLLAIDASAGDARAADAACSTTNRR